MLRYSEGSPLPTTQGLSYDLSFEADHSQQLVLRDIQLKMNWSRKCGDGQRVAQDVGKLCSRQSKSATNDCKGLKRKNEANC